MPEAKTWTVEIVIDEHERQTRARAELRTTEAATVGTGLARRNPHDEDVPAIGDELAVARALADLSHQLVEQASADIEAVTHRPTSLVE
jgi:hypothetical protein